MATTVGLVVKNGVCANRIVIDDSLLTSFASALSATVIRDIASYAGSTYPPDIGWTYNAGTGTFTDPVTSHSTVAPGV